MYAPTTAPDEETIAAFYDSLKEAKHKREHNDCKTIMGDMNAKVGANANLDLSGNLGTGELNQRGEKLLQWCVENKIRFLNTQFQNLKKKLETWTSPDKRTRSQIDFIMIDKRFRNVILDTQVDPKADCDSDQGLLVSEVRLRLKLKCELRASQPTIDFSACNEEKNDTFQEKFWEK